MRLIKAKLFIVFAILFMSNLLYAEDCGVALSKDYVYSNSKIQTRIAWYLTITEESYNKARKKRDGKVWGMINASPVGGELEYEEFKSAIEKLKIDYGYSFDTNQAHSHVASFLSENSKDAYIECLNKGMTGVIVKLVNVQEMSATLSVKWRKGAGDIAELKGPPSYLGVLPMTQLQKKWKHDSEQMIQLKRKSRFDDISVVINIGEESGSVFWAGDPMRTNIVKLSNGGQMISHDNKVMLYVIDVQGHSNGKITLIRDSVGTDFTDAYIKKNKIAIGNNSTINFPNNKDYYISITGQEPNYAKFQIVKNRENKDGTE